MFFLNVKLALRNIIRYKLYTLINLTGLTIGLLAFILTSLYVQYEYSIQEDQGNWHQEDKRQLFPEHFDPSEQGTPGALIAGITDIMASRILVV